ncbi:MAG: hypothetical protein ACRDHB_10630 [Actinomycetota bacterium]
MGSDPGDPQGQLAPSTSTGRRTAFLVLAWFLAVAGIAFGLFSVVFGFIDEGQRIHRFHNVLLGTLLLVLTAPPLVAAVRNPERATIPLMHLLVLSAAGLVTMAVALTVDSFTLPILVLLGVLWLLRPRKESPFPPGRPSVILLVLVLAAAVPLVLYSFDNARLQDLDSTSEHAELFHWVETSFTAAGVLFLGLLVSVRPAAYRMSVWCAGLATAILGAASLALPTYASAFDTSWAWAALAGGLAFVAVAEWEFHRAPTR